MVFSSLARLQNTRCFWQMEVMRCQRLQGIELSYYFSSLDLASVFHRIQIDNKDVLKTIFSGMNFLRVMNNIILGIQNERVFVCRMVWLSALRLLTSIFLALMQILKDFEP